MASVSESEFVDKIHPSHIQPPSIVGSSAWNSFMDGNGDVLLKPLLPAIHHVQKHVMYGHEHPEVQNFQTFHDSRTRAMPQHLLNIGKSLKFFSASSTLSGIVVWSVMYMSWMSILKQRGQSAIVFDIDDTLLTRTSLKGMPYQSSAIEPIKKLYIYALSLGFSVYIVTARPNTPQNLEFTKQELERLGYTKYTSLFLMPPEFESLMHDENSILFGDYSRYKYEARRYIVDKEQKEILLTIGDTWADLILESAPVNPEMSTYEERYQNDVCEFLKQGLPTDMCYILKLPDVALMGIKLPPKHIRTEI